MRPDYERVIDIPEPTHRPVVRLLSYLLLKVLHKEVGNHRPYPYPSLHPPYMYVSFPFTTHFNTEDEGSTVLRNDGIQPIYYTALQSRKL
jgi:hypothetical protein